MKIGIVGAGAAGLAALRHALQQNYSECVVFEQTDTIGGTWNYTDLTGIDKYGLPIRSSMYQGLITNLPKELMEYEDFPYEEIDRSFIGFEEVLKYMHSFANNFNLYPHIRFGRQVMQIKPLSNDKWSLKEVNLETKIITEHIFDAIMICIGNYSVPKLPDITGMDSVREISIHSHYYRKPDAYKGKRVLVIGAGPSGTDIAKHVGKIAEKVYISYGNNIFFRTPEYVTHKPLVKEFQKNKVLFVDDSDLEVDNIIYCTGYQYCYPFLSDDCGITVENNWVKYLYKHVVNIEHPTMAFIGITFKVCPFPTFDIQVRFFLEFLKNSNKLTKDDMLMDIFKDVQTKKVPEHLVHKIGVSLHESYFSDLADTLKIRKVRPVIHKLYEYLCENRNLEKRFKILNDEEFVELS
ncbi:hypothetical protein ABEB36_002514 [Hypothenemus hampei]|uniref:Flavin-containing monooxygenase n=1 Tax=Hypothenemus hampei TaxID=57062 RepID=A0ABD1F6P2_HYPHA